MKTPPFKFRYVEKNGARYLRLDDVARFLRELGSTEETDVRNRLNDAANKIASQGEPLKRSHADMEIES